MEAIQEEMAEMQNVLRPQVEEYIRQVRDYAATA